eukprot:CAMPEP_0168514960 /NCGR_PEP_ID=MMETSP0405-20121227/4435_1 /TAXON_ID=498012 /ORGANISM="Trichosphaerium sp, Strain Am-I-7 wt" /LENGTH=246 /DNA_ID=CAMNT_0008534215 /DNA_START=412 /DNA_END=1152 /DNA_ORIENTATION=+
MIYFPFTEVKLPTWFKVGFVDSGMIGVMVTVIAAQLWPQLITEAQPIRSLNIYGLRAGIWLAMIFEYIGIVHLSYLLTWITLKLCCCSLCGSDKITDVDAEDFLDTNFDNVSDLMDELKARCDDDDEDDYGIVLGDKDIERVKSLRKAMAKKDPATFHKYPAIIGNKAYPSPSMMAEVFRRKTGKTPAFLLPIDDPDHVPPHIQACELINKINEGKVKKRVARDLQTDDEESSSATLLTDDEEASS